MDGTQPTSGIADLVGETESAVATETPEQEAGTEPSGEEVETAAEPEVAETEQTEETSDDADQPQAADDPELTKFLAKKGLSNEKFNEYLDRYGLTREELNANPSLKFLVWDKINSDQELAKKNEPAKEEVKQDPPANLEEHLQAVAKEVATYNDPKVVEHYTKRLEAAKSTGEQVNLLSEMAVNLVNTMLDKKFDQYVNGYQTRATKAQQESIDAHKSAYDEIRGELPEFGSDEYKSLAEAAIKAVPKLETDVFTPKERMQILVTLSQGKKTEAQTIAQGIEKGVKQAEQKTQQTQLGKALGAGQSKGKIGPAQPKGNDDIFGDGVKEYRHREKLGRS
jgi:hypothetical protein